MLWETKGVSRLVESIQILLRILSQMRMKVLGGLLLGLGIGIAGTLLFLQSLPPDAGSAEERADIAETALDKAEVVFACELTGHCVE